MTQIWYDWGAGGVGMGSDYSKDRNLSFVSIYLSLLVFMLFNLYVFSCQIWWKTKHRNLLGQWSIYRQEPFLCLHLIFCLHFAHFLFTFVKFYTFIYKTQICYSQGAGWSIYRQEPFLCLHLTFCGHNPPIVRTFLAPFCTHFDLFCTHLHTLEHIWTHLYTFTHSVHVYLHTFAEVCKHLAAMLLSLFVHSSHHHHPVLPASVPVIADNFWAKHEETIE